MHELPRVQTLDNADFTTIKYEYGFTSRQSAYYILYQEIESSPTPRGRESIAKFSLIISLNYTEHKLVESLYK